MLRRIKDVWWWGFALLAANMACPVAGVFVRADPGDARMPVLVSSGFSVAIGVFLARRWQAQRNHFHD